MYLVLHAEIYRSISVEEIVVGRTARKTLYTLAIASPPITGQNGQRKKGERMSRRVEQAIHAEK